MIDTEYSCELCGDPIKREDRDIVRMVDGWFDENGTFNVNNEFELKEIHEKCLELAKEAKEHITYLEQQIRLINGQLNEIVFHYRADGLTSA